MGRWWQYVVVGMSWTGLAGMLMDLADEDVSNNPPPQAIGMTFADAVRQTLASSGIKEYSPDWIETDPLTGDVKISVSKIYKDTLVNRPADVN